MRARAILCCVILTLCPSAVRADPIVLKNDRIRVAFDPATLAADLVTPDGKKFPISSPSDSVDPHDLQVTGIAHFRRGDVAISARVQDAELIVDFEADQTGTITWPIVPAARAKALILPTYEGAYVPTDDADWREFLVKQSPLDTTAGLIMPFWGLELDGSTLTYILTNAFNNELTFTPDLGMALKHEFTPNQTKKSFGVIVQLTDPSPVAPAKAYRQYLIARNEFVPMRKKIEQTPRASRLLGAAQVYVWGDSLLSRYDVRDWRKFATKLESNAAALAKFDDETRKQIHEIATNDWPGDYAKDIVVRGLSDQFHDAASLTAAFGPDAFADPVTWGDGVSTKMLDQLHADGLDRMCFTTGGIDSALHKPEVAKHADELGYLFGPYDSYHSIHRPGSDEPGETTQFDQHLYDTGPIVRRDGTKRPGFQQQGFALSPLAARPYVESRVNDRIKQVPFTSWFVDCDAFGEFFDDYSPLHPATQQQDAQARCDRMKWMSSAHGLVVGSEGGTAPTAPAIHFAHGMMTPVIGWGDPDLTSRDSKYFLGSYWPPDGPAVFVKQVPLKPYYHKLFFDPRYRLPLYETVFHDSVIATHHWSSASLKFIDQVQTVALLESLYNVPPLYHLNLAEYKKHRERIKAHYAFFSPLHRELALEPMSEFAFVTDDRLIQRTQFADRAELIANFRDQPFDYHGQPIAPHSILARWLDGSDASVYSPKP